MYTLVHVHCHPCSRLSLVKGKIVCCTRAINALCTMTYLNYDHQVCIGPIPQLVYNFRNVFIFRTTETNQCNHMPLANHNITKSQVWHKRPIPLQLQSAQCLWYPYHQLGLREEFRKEISLPPPIKNTKHKFFEIRPLYTDILASVT